MGMTMRGPKRSSNGPTKTPPEKTTNTWSEKTPEKVALLNPNSERSATKMTENECATPFATVILLKHKGSKSHP
jgi:hypothetical protein